VPRCEIFGETVYRRSGREANLEAGDGDFLEGEASWWWWLGLRMCFFCTALSQTKNHRGFGKATRTNVMMIFSQAKMLASIDSVKMFRPIVLSLSLFLLKALNETAACFFMILLMEEVWRFGAHELI